MTTFAVNLIPADWRRAQRERRRTHLWLAICILIAAASGVACAAFRLAGSDDRAAAQAALLASSDRYAKAQSALGDAKARAARLEKALLAAQAVGEHPDWSVLLTHLAESRGDDTRLESVSLAAARVDQPARGKQPRKPEADPARATEFRVVITGVARTQVGATALALRLEKAGLLDGVRLLTTRPRKTADGELIEFTIEAALRPRAAQDARAQPPLAAPGETDS